MPTRQDQLLSHQFSRQRVVAALVAHNPDPVKFPLRRTGAMTLAGILIAALIIGAVAVYGLITGNAPVPVRDPAVVFLEKGSGARYVYLDADDRLHPVLNYASGLLIADAQSPKLVTTTRSRLAGVPLGEPLGIPGAPDALPSAKELQGTAWSVCSSSAADPRTTVLVGEPVRSGRTPAGLLAREPNGQIHLIVNGHRSLIPSARTTATLRALGWNTQQPWPVATGFLNAVPAAPDLIAPTIPLFEDASAVPGTLSGRLLTDGTQWSVALPDGAAAVTDVQARLLRAEPDAYEPRRLEHSAFINLPASATRLDQPALPARVPELTTPTQHVCLTTVPTPEGSTTPPAPAEIRVDPTVPEGTPAYPGTEAPGAARADFVHVPRGAGVLTVTAASPDAPPGTGTVSLVTDLGMRYPVAGRELLPRLGYAGVTPLRVPSSIVALLPEGPSLDAVRAREPASVTGRYSEPD